MTTHTETSPSSVLDTVKLTLTAAILVGGIAGYLRSSDIYAGFVSGSIDGIHHHVGGLLLQPRDADQSGRVPPVLRAVLSAGGGEYEPAAGLLQYSTGLAAGGAAAEPVFSQHFVVLRCAKARRGVKASG